MEKEFDFKNIGKRMPYRTLMAFSENAEASIGAYTG